MLNGVGVDDSPPRVLVAVTSVLEKLVARNERLTEEQEEQQRSSRALPVPNALDEFRAARAPSITIGKYLGRIYKYSGCSPSCFVVAFAYVDRLLHMYPGALVVSVNVHRLLLAGVLVASKVLDDVHHDNAFYARVGGVSNEELNRLELELLFRLNFSVMVSFKVFENYSSHLEKEMMLKEMMHQKLNQQLPLSICTETANANGGDAEALIPSLLPSPVLQMELTPHKD